MRYNVVKNAERIVDSSEYLIKNPNNYKNQWKEVFGNLKMICADANEISNMFGKEIDTIYLTFSEPWPKEKDAKKRFTSVNYLKLYDRIFKKNKHIIMKTDNKILFASALESLSDYWYTFNRVSLDLHSDERHIEDEEIVTDFERQYIKEKRPIYYVDAVFND